MDGRIEWLPPEDGPGDPGAAPPPTPEAVDTVTAGPPDSELALAWERFGDRLRAVSTRARVGAAATLTAGVVVAGYLATGGSSPRATADRPIAVVPSESPTTATKGDAVTSALVAKALQPARLGDIIRPTAQPGGCALVPPGHSPGAATTAALARILPGYRPRDVGRILDQSTGLCALDLRAADSAGSVVLVEVLPPGTARRRSYPQVLVSTLSDGRISSSIASTVSVDGWSIAVVAVGRLTDQPDVADMLSLTDDASLRW